MSARLRIAAALALGALVAGSAPAQPLPACKIGRFDATASVFHLDADGDGLWSPDGTGNRSIAIDVAWPGGVPLVGDWNGDGFDDVGKQVGTWYRVDLDGDGVWEGNAGGDRNADFAPEFGPGVPVVGDWNGDGKDEIGTYIADGYQFLLDLNGNGIWDDVAGGDAQIVIQATALMPGMTTVPLVGDWDGDGDDEIGLTTGSGRLYLDLNGSHHWDGSAGGDFEGAGGFMTLVGDWNGDGRDDNGRFVSEMFLVDFYGYRNPSADSGGGFKFATQFTPGTPLVCDWDGDGTSNLGKVVGDAFLLDLNANGSWDGNALGDRNAVFAIAPTGPPLAGRWKP